ncbi:MAG TPA: ABC transporter substrate-binding protein [Kiritimatiellia bacterium]|nr:ABC transporter substrate-binding protein [Kiritimatiellia bacterium]
MKIMVWMTGWLVMTGVTYAELPRIVCLGGAVTETVWALGGADWVIGVDDSSTFPEDAGLLPRVGYYRMISAEGVLSLHPDLVLASEEAGPREALMQIERAGVRVERIRAEASVEGCLQRIHEVGVAIGRAEAAEALANEIGEAMAGLTVEEGRERRVMFVFAHGAGAMNVAGRDTAADRMIRLAGGRNAVTGYRGYRPLTSEAMVAADPEVILVTTGSLPAFGGGEAIWRVPGVQATSAYAERRVVAMDDLLLLGFGPRLPSAVMELQRLIGR